MKQKVHRAEARDAVDQLDPEERAILELLLLRPVELIMLREVIMRREQETAGAAGRIADRLARLRSDRVHYRGDERARGEVLARAAFHFLAVLLQQTLRRRRLSHRRREAGPLFRVDQVHDEPTQLSRDPGFCFAPC